MKRKMILNLTVIIAVTTAAFSSVDGSEWQIIYPQTPRYLAGVWGSAADDVYAVGNSGLILHYDGNPGMNWEQIPIPTMLDLRSIWGSSANDIWAVGEDGAILHSHNGIDWQLEPGIPGYKNFMDIWGTAPDNIWAVGRDVASGLSGLIWHWNGVEWNEELDTSEPLGATQFEGIWGSGPDEIFVVGAGSGGSQGICYKYNGTSWSPEWSATGWPNMRYYIEVWGTNNELFISGQSYSPSIAEAAHYNGSLWETEIFQNSGILAGVWGSGEENLYMVGNNGLIVHYDGTTFSEMVSGTNLHLQDVWGSETGHVFVVGGDGEQTYGTILYLGPTNQLVVYLKDDAGIGLVDEDVVVQPAYGGSWGPKYYGTTDSNGALTIVDMEEGYTKIRMTFNQASVEQTVAELNASGYTWTAVPLTIEFLDDLGFGLIDGKVDQGGGTWVHHGYTDGAGQFSLHVFPEKQYKFRVGYPCTSMTKWFNVPGPGAHTEIFQTVLATVTVLDYEGYGLADVKVDQGGGSWIHHGYTDGSGELDLQLFGGTNYKFKVSGDVVSNSSKTTWFAVPGPIEFQTGYVVSGGTAIKAAIGGRWITYSSPGMHILPGTYKFVFAAPTPSPQWITVTAGEITNIP